MKMIMTIKEAQGYSKEKALVASGLDVDVDLLKNASQAWKKVGSPINKKELNAFMESYLKTKKASAAYIQLESASNDTRMNPYTVINESTNGRRKSTTVYQIKEADFDVKYVTETVEKLDPETGDVKLVEVKTPYRTEAIEVETVNPETGETETKIKEVKIPMVKVTSVGAVAGRADKKDTAMKLMKELIAETKSNYVIEIVKEITEGQKYAAYGEYTPSKSAKLGKFIFFTRE
jgi:hypothetical protein